MKHYYFRKQRWVIMLSKKNIKDYLEIVFRYKAQYSGYDIYNVYLSFLLTIFLIPICLILDIILLPFEIGYLIFKKVVKRWVIMNDEIKITMSNGTLTYEITLQQYAINENTREWLLKEIKAHLEAIMEDFNERWNKRNIRLFKKR